MTQAALTASVGGLIPDLTLQLFCLKRAIERSFWWSNIEKNVEDSDYWTRWCRECAFYHAKKLATAGRILLDAGYVA